jgi:glycosyltransferase involved in cell wall biosynthesis
VKISIITVVYNAQETIVETIKSVLNQDFVNVEYLIIDGGSSDRTNEIISRYKSEINFYLSEPDKGLYDAMNKGIENATGDIIGILNADDVFMDNTVLSNISRVFKEKPQIDATIGNIIQCNKQGNVTRFYSSKNWQPNKLKIGFMPPHPSIFFKKSVFTNFGNYKLNYKIGADFEFIVRVFLKNKIEWNYSNLTTTKMLVGGLSSSGISSYKRISAEIIKSLKENDIKYFSFLIQFRIVWKIKELLLVTPPHETHQRKHC